MAVQTLHPHATALSQFLQEMVQEQRSVIVNSNTLQITTQNDHVFAISLVKVSGTGTTIAAPVPKGTLAVITSESQIDAADALAVQSDG